eukprot:UN3822
MDTLVDQASSNTADFKDTRKSATIASSAPVSTGGLLTNFQHVASEHLSNIQLVDTVHLDPLTGKVVLLLYTSIVEEHGVDTTPGQEAWMLLLDAARGMQTVAMPVPVRELHRCSL